MRELLNVPLKDYTSFGVGGPAERLIIVESAYEILKLEDHIDWIMGYGTNSVVSDDGLPGLTVIMRGEKPPVIHGTRLKIDAATSWDTAVEAAIQHDLWGIELMSGIPGNTGAALTGNIGAYGQTMADTFAEAEVFNRRSRKVETLTKEDISLSYRHSSLQNPNSSDLIVISVTLDLTDTQKKPLRYSSAMSVAKELNLSLNDLKSLRSVILATRERAGSMYAELDPNRERTAGSFFKASVVDKGTSMKLAEFDESGKSVAELLEQNKLQGGDAYRASAALVLLAAGFKRGQNWGAVKLHDRHVLKLQNTSDATAQNIYDVSRLIQEKVAEELNVSIEPEAKFIGRF